MLICKDCEQLTTDDSPQVSALTLEALAVEPEPPTPASDPGGNRRPPAMARQETGTTG